MVAWEVLGINCCVDYRKPLNGVVVRLGAFCCFYVFFIILKILVKSNLIFLLYFKTLPDIMKLIRRRMMKDVG